MILVQPTRILFYSIYHLTYVSLNKAMITNIHGGEFHRMVCYVLGLVHFTYFLISALYVVVIP